MKQKGFTRHYSKSGFVQIILVLMVAALVGGGMYYFGTLKNKSEVVVETPTEEPIAGQTQKPGAPTVKPTSDPTSNWRKLDLINWQFKVPADWKYLECNKLSIFVGPNIDKDSSQLCEFDGSPGYISVSRITNPEFKIPTNRDPNLDPYVVRKDNIVVDGRPAVKQVEKVTSGMGEGERIYVYVESQDYMDVIVLQNVVNDGVLDQILSTFKFTK